VGSVMFIRDRLAAMQVSGPGRRSVPGETGSRLPVPEAVDRGLRQCPQDLRMVEYR
jgi:hypothetical protein